MTKASDGIAVAWITKCYNRCGISSGVKLIPKLSAKILPFFFNTRYWLARQTRKHKHFGNFIRKRFFDGDDMVVLPKDSVVKDINVDISIDSAGDRTILPSDVVKALIDRTDDIFIMNFCLCRKSNSCKDYPINHGCVFLGRGIRKIPEKFGRVATKDEAKAYIDECTELGFVHIIGRNKLDSMWLNVKKFNTKMLILSSIMASFCVAFCGIIGFVGLVIPHLCRMIFGGDHRLVMPASIAFGGCLMIFADLVARMALNSQELPVGAITTLIGVPVFLYLLIKRGKIYNG